MIQRLPCSGRQSPDLQPDKRKSKKAVELIARALKFYCGVLGFELT